jgi:hypothetical protein
MEEEKKDNKTEGKKQEEMKIEKSEEEKKEQKQQTMKLEKNVKNLLLIIVVVIIASIIAFAFKDQITDTIKDITGTRFNYYDFKFEKFYFGEILMYQTPITVNKNNQLVSYDLILRNDPRELEKEIEVPTEELNLMSITFFSLAPETDECNETILAAWKIGEFLGALGKNNSGAVIDIKQLDGTVYENDFSKVKTCDDAIDSSVIILQKSETNESKIYKENENCFILSYKDCETLKISERFVTYLILELSKK